MDKLIGTAGDGQGGTLFVVFSQIHGNEPAGTEALHTVFNTIRKDPNIHIKGAVMGIVGNLSAAQLGQRYLDQDLNRMWSPENIRRIASKNPLDLMPEERELLENLAMVENQVQRQRPAKMAVLDLHTTTAEGGIFTFPNNEPASGELADPIGAPVIHGMTNYLSGTTLHYFTTGRYGLPIASTAFEAGQHQEKEAIARCERAIWGCLGHLGMLDRLAPTGDVSLSQQPITEHWELVHRHPVLSDDQFVMRPGYKNFQPIQEGELLADDVNGPIPSPMNGHILMPLYQKMGSDGFFVIKNKLYSQI